MHLLWNDIYVKHIVGYVQKIISAVCTVKSLI